MPLESYLLAQDDFTAISIAVQSFSRPSGDLLVCYFPSKAFIKTLLEKNDDKIMELLEKSSVYDFIFECAIENGNITYIEKCYKKPDFYLEAKYIIALFELGCNKIAEDFLEIFGRFMDSDDKLVCYLKKHNLYKSTYFM